MMPGPARTWEYSGPFEGGVNCECSPGVFARGAICPHRFRPLFTSDRADASVRRFPQRQALHAKIGSATPPPPSPVAPPPARSSGRLKPAPPVLRYPTRGRLLRCIPSPKRSGPGEGDEAHRRRYFSGRETQTPCGSPDRTIHRPQFVADCAIESVASGSVDFAYHRWREGSVPACTSMPPSRPQHGAAV